VAVAGCRVAELSARGARRKPEGLRERKLVGQATARGQHVLTGPGRLDALAVQQLFASEDCTSRFVSNIGCHNPRTLSTVRCQ
jgi:hypothetical protein